MNYPWLAYCSAELQSPGYCGFGLNKNEYNINSHINLENNWIFVVCVCGANEIYIFVLFSLIPTAYPVLQADAGAPALYTAVVNKFPNE